MQNIRCALTKDLILLTKLPYRAKIIYDLEDIYHCNVLEAMLVCYMYVDINNRKVYLSNWL